MFERLRFRNGPRANIHALYVALVAQARRPLFYGDYGVPDTVEGRFDMILLHVYLVWRRLSNTEPGREVAQEVFDLFFKDMDESMRELGVGDLSVPKKVRAMGEAFYGRSGAYDAALKEPNDGALAVALGRNIFDEVENAQPAAQRLARYVRAADRMLAKQPAEDFARGKIVFPAPEEIAA